MKKLYKKPKTASAIIRGTVTKVMIAAVALFTMVSCDDDDDLALCDTNNTVFQQTYSATLSSDPEFIEKVIMDVEVHSYTFRVNTNKTICKVGYQSQPNLSTPNPYTIRIINTVNNQVVYTGAHTFSDTQTSYVDVGSVAITANVDYRIEREVAMENTTSDLIGRVIMPDIWNGATAQLAFPVNQGIMTITGTSCYSTAPSSSSADDEYLPFIDIVFQN